MKLFGNTHRKKCPCCGVVIAAAGSGQRMQGMDKLLTELCGRPVIAHTIAAFEEADCIHEIVIVARKDQQDVMEDLVKTYGFQKVRTVVPGGGTRAESVQRGLAALGREMDLAAVQDGARPLVTAKLITETVERAVRSHAAAPAVPVKDTIKLVDEDQRVEETPDRARLRAVQTPQVFQRDLLLAAWEKARQSGAVYTDDCGAMEALGVPVYLTRGSEENLKITTRLDLVLAEHIMKEREHADRTRL